MFLIGETLWFYCSKSTVFRRQFYHTTQIDGQYSVFEHVSRLRRFSELPTLGDIIHWGGTVFTSEKCPGGQYSRGDSIHSYTVSVEMEVERSSIVAL